jgi:hypothetical protein
MSKNLSNNVTEITERLLNVLLANNSRAYSCLNHLNQYSQNIHFIRIGKSSLRDRAS